ARPRSFTWANTCSRSSASWSRLLTRSTSKNSLVRSVTAGTRRLRIGFYSRYRLISKLTEDIERFHSQQQATVLHHRPLNSGDSRIRGAIEGCGGPARRRYSFDQKIADKSSVQ